MAMIGQWNGIRFEISHENTVLFQNLKLTAECETKDKEAGSQHYVSAKAGKAAQISMTILLNASLGTDVRQTAMTILDQSQRGAADHFYVGGKKLFPFKVMLVKADTEKILISPSGTWVSAEINVTMKQSGTEPILYEEPEPGTESKTNGADHWDPLQYILNLTNNAKVVNPPISKGNTNFVYREW